MRRIYLASSWRNTFQPQVLRALDGEGHEVYDFRHPAPGVKGFAWSDIDQDWQTWSTTGFRNALNDPVADGGFANDWDAMEWADTGVLLLPSGRSAHIEAGYFVGHPAKSLHILMMEPQEPELMYKMADSLSLSISELIGALA